MVVCIVLEEDGKGRENTLAFRKEFQLGYNRDALSSIPRVAVNKCRPRSTVDMFSFLAQQGGAYPLLDVKGDALLRIGPRFLSFFPDVSLVLEIKVGMSKAIPL